MSGRCPYQPAAEILFDADDGTRQYRLEFLDSKLPPELFVVDPIAERLDGFAFVDRREVARDGNRLGALPAFRHELRDGVMVLFVRVDDALDDAFNGLDCLSHWIAHARAGYRIRFRMDFLGKTPTAMTHAGYCLAWGRIGRVGFGKRGDSQCLPVMDGEPNRV